MAYWYNVDTGQVETDEERGKDAQVMGPYATREEATAALNKAAGRTEAWKDEEERERRQRREEVASGERINPLDPNQDFLSTD